MGDSPEDRIDGHDQAFDLSAASLDAAEAARSLISDRHGAGAPGRLAKDSHVREAFVYAWLKSMARHLGRIQPGLDKICVLATTEDGDPCALDVVILTEARSAALDLLASSLEKEFAKVRERDGLTCVLKVRTLTQEDVRRGQSLLSCLFTPAMQVWP